LNAGHAASSWPLMNGSFFPENAAALSLRALVDDPYLTHFVHRWWAVLALVAILLLARRTRALGNRPVSIALHTAVGVQIALGIATVLSGVAIWLAVLHQAVGAILVACTAWGAHLVGRRTGASEGP
jgi:cytochrome c oxidase assembly protein subunit 15